MSMYAVGIMLAISVTADVNITKWFGGSILATHQTNAM